MITNLAPEKSVVFREVVRILKPGGRLAVSVSESTLDGQLADLFKQYDVNESAASVKVFAVKPERG